ncbi:MAG: gephyrin-like molybdotransferase Glp [Acidobacteriota bacterium]
MERRMVSFEEALSIILSKINPLESKETELLNCLDLVLQEDVISPIDIPPFNNSAMDGYAVRSEDIKRASFEKPVVLEVIEELWAGKKTKCKIGERKAVKIMTGAPIPEGADTVVKVEDTKKIVDRKEYVKIFVSQSPGENIRLAGENVKRGELILSKGRVLGPAEIGMAASLGLTKLKVIRKPKIAVIATGNELVKPGKKLKEFMIYESNLYALASLIKKYSGIPINMGIARDNLAKIKDKINHAIMKSDLILTSAGVSVGEYDFVREALISINGNIYFWQVAVKPGKPLVFGEVHGKPLFGLPGNPVSNITSFLLFVRPAILKMMGKKPENLPIVKAILEEEIKKKGGRRHFLRGIIRFDGDRAFVKTTGPQGSGILKSMVLANCLIVIPEDVKFIPHGEKIDCLLI